VGSNVTTQIWSGILQQYTLCATMTFDLWQHWVMWPGARAEYICLISSLYTLYFLKYAAIKCRFRGPVARQPALPWQPFCAPLVGRSSSCQPPSTKLIGPPHAELWQILAVYIICQCDLDLCFSKLGPLTGSSFWIYVPKFKFIDLIVFDIRGHKMQILWPCC